MVHNFHALVRFRRVPEGCRTILFAESSTGPQDTFMNQDVHHPNLFWPPGPKRSFLCWLGQMAPCALEACISWHCSCEAAAPSGAKSDETVRWAVANRLGLVITALFVSKCLVELYWSLTDGRKKDVEVQVMCLAQICRLVHFYLASKKPEHN